jgi:hypothetical protein
MGFAPLEEIEGPIVLPLRGREYTLPVISFEQGLALQARITEGITPGELAEALLGDVLTELAQAGASGELIQRVTMVALAEWKFGRSAAEEAWRDPKAPLELIKVIRQAYEAARTTPTAAETTTPPPASGNGTRKTPAKATPSRGKRSSDTGRSS